MPSAVPSLAGMRVSPPVPGMTSDESTPLVVHRESASAAAKRGVWFSRKATLALVGACAIVSVSYTHLTLPTKA